MNTDPDILYARKCPYCGEKPLYVDSIEVYRKRSYGMIYLCRPCDAFVGVHKGTDNPLGRLANKELRNWKQSAHAYFDPLWKRRGKHKRSAAYDWLSEELGIDRQFTHIGMFDVEECRQVVELCKRYYK